MAELAVPQPYHIFTARLCRNYRTAFMAAVLDPRGLDPHGAV